MKLNIENFQSLRGENELEFKPGITMVVGASNSGKTAVIRALRGLILNYIPTSKANRYISHKTDHLKVDLTLEENGPTYSLIKTEKSTEYSITQDGETIPFEKAGNDDLFSIVEKAPSELELQPFPFVLRDKKLINTHTEKDSLPFPFDLNDVELFKMFEELYNVSSSSVIFKFMKSLETKTNSQIKSIKEEIESDKVKVEKIIDLEDKYNLEELDQLKVRAEKIQAGMLGIDEDIETASSNNKTCKKIKTFLEEIIDPAEKVKQLEKLKTLINESKDLAKDIRIVNSNSKIEQVNVYKKEFEIAVIDAYNSLSSDYNKANKLNKELKSTQEEIDELLEEQKGIQEQLSKIKVCPLCHQPIKKGEIHND